MSLILVLVSNTPVSKRLFRNRQSPRPGCHVALYLVYLRGTAEGEPRAALPVPASPVLDQIWQMMQAEGGSGRFADLAVNFFSLWGGFLLAQQVARLDCEPCEAAPLFSFSSAVERPERSLLLAVGGPKQNCGFCYHLERGSYILQCWSTKSKDYMCTLESLNQTFLSGWVTVK